MDFLLTKVAYGADSDFDSFLLKVNDLIINPLILFLFALAIVFFLYGVLEFMLNQENEEKKTVGKKHMIYGVIGIAIMMGVFTILEIVLNTFDINQSEINVREGEVELEPFDPPSNLFNK